MKKIFFIGLFVSGLCYSCKNEESSEKPMSTISSSLGTNPNDTLSEFKELSLKNYELEALWILENGKKRLQVALPLTIKSQVDLYEETLQKFSEQAVSSLCLEQTKNKIIEAEAEMAIQMLEDEMKLNKIYYDLVYELEQLNEKYASFVDPKEEKIYLTNYHDSPSMVYSHDIFQKVKEFVNSEKSYNNGRFRNSLLSSLEHIGSAVSFIPPLRVIGTVVTVGSMEARALNQRVMEEEAGVPIPEKLAPSAVILSLFGAMENPEEREIIKAELKERLQIAINGEKDGPRTINILSAQDYKDARRQFSGFGNELKGRIGDFSDGIVTQPIGHLRNMIDHNVKILESHTSTEQILQQ